jgi:hypothetical protein
LAEQLLHPVEATIQMIRITKEEDEQVVGLDDGTNEEEVN